MPIRLFYTVIYFELVFYCIFHVCTLLTIYHISLPPYRHLGLMCQLWSWECLFQRVTNQFKDGDINSLYGSGDYLDKHPVMCDCPDIPQMMILCTVRCTQLSPNEWNDSKIENCSPYSFSNHAIIKLAVVTLLLQLYLPLRPHSAGIGLQCFKLWEWWWSGLDCSMPTAHHWFFLHWSLWSCQGQFSQSNKCSKFHVADLMVKCLVGDDYCQKCLGCCDNEGCIIS